MQELGPNQEKWLEALESEKYTQGRSSLKTQDKDNSPKYCCLGVGCEIFDVERHDQLRNGDFPFGGDRTTCYAPVELKEILALYGDQGDSDFYREQPNKFRSLISYNDYEKKTFKEIAKIVRDNPDIYFSETR
jgi:hypothetical protein